MLAERGMVLVGNEDEETTCEDEDRANANGKFDCTVIVGKVELYDFGPPPYASVSLYYYNFDVVLNHL